MLQLIEELKQRLGVPDRIILFTDEFWTSLASVVGGQFNVINSTRPMRKIVLLRPRERITDFSAIDELTSMNPQSGQPWPLSGHMIERSFYLALGPPRRYDEVPGRPCHFYPPLILMGVVQYLDLNQELAQLGGNLNRPETKEALCQLIEERLREMGRILNEVVPPKKPLLE